MLIKCKILLFDFPTLYLAGISHHQARRITILKPHEFLWYKLSHHYIRVLIVYICIGLRLSVKMSLVSPLLLKLSQHSSPASPTSRPSLLSVSLWPPRLGSSQNTSRAKADWDFNVDYANENQIKVNPLSWSNFSIDIQIRWKYLWSKSKYTTAAVKLSIRRWYSVTSKFAKFIDDLLLLAVIRSDNNLES